MRKKPTLSLLILGLLFLSAAGVWAQCTSYGNSSAVEGTWDGGGPHCAGSGGGCTECIDWNPGPGIFFNVCYYDWGGSIYCYSWGSEIQGF